MIAKAKKGIKDLKVSLYKNCRNVVELVFSGPLSSISGKDLPLYIDDNYDLCFRLNTSSIPYRVFLISIPKSGTYLFAEILEKIGLVNCDVHIATDEIQDNRFASYESLRTTPSKYVVPLKMDKSVLMIRSGQFSFGHIPYHDVNLQNLLNFKKIFSSRQLRDVIISLTRYYGDIRVNMHEEFADSIREKSIVFENTKMGTEKIRLWFELWGNEYSSLIENIIHWKEISDVLVVDFETLMGDLGKENQFNLVKQLGSCVDVEIDNSTAADIIENTIGKKTITYSGERSSYKDWWNDELEELFISYGFNKWNKELGYE